MEFDIRNLLVDFGRLPDDPFPTDANGGNLEEVPPSHDP